MGKVGKSPKAVGRKNRKHATPGSKAGGSGGAQSPKTVDDLMDMMDSSDGSGSAEEEEVVVKAKTSAKTSKKAKKSKQPAGGDGDDSEVEDEEALARDMEQLKYTDPEFYAFLKQDEPGLLNFKPSADDEEDSDDDEEDDEEAEGAVSDEGEVNEGESDEEHDVGPGDSEEEEEDEVEEDMTEGQRTITKDMVKDWEARVMEKHSVEALKQLLDAFRCAVHMQDGDDDDEMDAEEGGKKGKKKKAQKSMGRYRIDNSAVFNTLVVLCLRRLPEALDHLMQMKSPQPGKRTMLAAHSPLWRKHKNLVKGFVANLLHFVRQLVEPNMLGFVLKSVERSAAYFASYPKIARALLKTCVDIWGKGEEHVRVMAFLTVRKLAVISPKAYLDPAIRGLYMMYAKNAKFTTAQSQPTLTFMENCVVEICGLDPYTTYTHMFVYVRQLAIHLRGAMTTRKKDAYSSVYNWQYLHCLQVWSRVVSDHYCPTLAPLTYPLTQILMGTIRMIPTARYFPLRFHCVRALNAMARATRAFIPVAPLVLEVLDSQHVKGAPKKGTAKPPLFAYIYKVSKSTLGTKVFQEGCVDQVVGLLLEHLAIYSTHIAFPEYIVPTVLQLRAFLSTCKNGKVKGQLKQILDKTKQNIGYIVDARACATFSPRDAKSVVQWNANMAALAQSPLNEYSTSWAKVEKARQAAFDAARGPQEGEEEEEEEDSDGEGSDGGEEGGMDDMGSEDYDSEDEAEEESERPSKSQGASNKIVFNSDDEDAEADHVGDFVLSDSD